MLLKNATIFLPTGASTKSEILLENGRIACVSNSGKTQTNSEVIDLSGAKLFAGFIDIHNHGAIGIDANDANSDELHRVSKFLASKGVTSWLPTLVPDSTENYSKSIAAIDELISTQDDREPAARVLGVHYEGPFVSEKQCGALRTRFFQTFERGNKLDFLPKLNTRNAVHLITVAPEISGGIELIGELKRQNWIVSIGHTRAETGILETAFAAGARHLTHFFNAMTNLHHRNLGVVGWALTKSETTVDVIADGVHVAPGILKLLYQVKTAANISLISDSVAPTGLGDGDYEIWGEKISVVNGRTENERGSIAGSVITMLDAVKTMQKLGIAETKVSQMASLNPAKLLKIENNCGSIETGKRADLTAIDENGRVILTIVAGRVAYQAEKTKF